MFKITICICPKQFLGQMLRTKEFLGPRKCQFLDKYCLKTRNILKSIIEQQQLRMILLTIGSFLFLINDPIREFQGQYLKCYFLNNSKTVMKLGKLVEQKLFEISRPLSRYQSKRADPLNQGSKEFKSIFKNIFLSIIMLFQFIETKIQFLTI